MVTAQFARFRHTDGMSDDLDFFANAARVGCDAQELLTGDEPFLPLDGNGSGGGSGSAEQDDALYDEAVQFVLESRRASISSVQRKLRIGYNRAARLIEAMEEAGVVTPMNSNGSREVLVPKRD